MIVFVAGYPDESSSKEGMNVRIRSIDRYFVAQERLYLRCSWKLLRSRRRRISENCVEHDINPLLHFPSLLAFVLRSKAVYVHSVFNAFCVLPSYFLHRRIFTDIHGAVPEELQFNGKPMLGMLFNAVEKVVYKKSFGLVCVTDAMADLLRRKHSQTSATFFYAPMINDLNVCSSYCANKARPSSAGTVVYVGGTQRWQNVSLMVGAIKKCPKNLNYIFATPDIELMQEAFRGVELGDRFRMLTVAKNDLPELYLNADYGFVLREENELNQVAFPTKLIEYLMCGVIPIVLQRRIGDFKKLGFRHVLLADFVEGKLPSITEREEMRAENHRIISQLLLRANNEMATLVNRLVEHQGLMNGAN
jgi:hypothetical protein